MFLDGAKLICLNNGARTQGDIIPVSGKTFKFGYYMDCDYILEHSDALGLHCTIACDAFGRVTIENLCPEQPITLDGKAFKKVRPLLHNTEICILDKKFLWQFEGSVQSAGFHMEDVSEFTTPCKQVKAEQPPNSEPARRWRTQIQRRLTVHSFAYCIKAGESPQDVDVTVDENKPLNTHDKTTFVETEPASTKRAPSLSPVAADLIDLKTPKVKLRSIVRQKTPLSCCKLSETVITSYSPRETGVRPEKSFAIVQSPTTTCAKSTAVSDVSLGPFQYLPSPLTHNHRPSMHLIDLTTPMKVIPPTSAARTLLISALKKKIPKSKEPQHQQPRSNPDTSAASMESSVYSVHSTEDESVIELSDDVSFSPSPVVKTPPRPRTPQSLMKRAILSSAKKAAITKRLQQPAPPPVPPPLTPKNPPGVRFQSHSTPQRKSLGRFQSPIEGLEASGKASKSMITSTPFRAAESKATGSKQSSILRSPSTSLTGVKNKSRTSLMLKQALAKSPQLSVTQKRKSVSFLEATQSPCKSLKKARKSVSFLDRIQKEQAEDNATLNRTFSIEEDANQVISSSRKDAKFSPEKEEWLDDEPTETKKEDKVEKEKSLGKTVCNATENVYVSGSHSTRKAVKGLPGVSYSAKEEDKCDTDSITHVRLSATFTPPERSGNSFNPQTEDSITSTTNPQLTEADTDKPTQSIPQTPQSSRRRSKYDETPHTVSTIHDNLLEDDDFEGLDTIFKTPKARNLMILSSPKSISLQKPTTESVELMHSTEFDLSTNLDDIFKTPQSEFITNPVEAETTSAVGSFSPEEAFDMLVGRPITKRSYSRKTPPQKQELSPLKVPKDPTFPKTDIEEWIENANMSLELLDGNQDEDEMSYLTATQSEASRDPLTMTGNTTKKETRSPKDESAMTIQEDDEELTVSKNPLAGPSPKRSLSPNISGIDLLDHTSESLFSETLAVSDESSEKDETLKCVEREFTLSPDEAHREMEQAFENFERERKIVEGKRVVSTPEPKKRTFEKDSNRRRTTDNEQALNALFDLEAEREVEFAYQHVSKDLELEDLLDVASEEGETIQTSTQLAFENFEKEPVFAKAIVSKTPELKKRTLKDRRRSMEGILVSEVDLDLNALKAAREVELAFENFEEEPEFTQERVVNTPETKKVSVKDHRRNMGSNLVSKVKLDLEAVKVQREMELAFENFKEEPEFTQERIVKTPEFKKEFVKDHRRTMGSSLVQEVKLDLKAAKAQREMELAFENFEEEPEFTQERAAKTPEPKKESVKDHRRTMGSSLVQEVKLDLKAAKAQREIELAFENFEEEPEFTQERAAKTPEPKKESVKDHRRTMGSSLVQEVKLDLKAAKAQREMELAFENFEEEPEFTQERIVKSPEPKKEFAKDHRRTMGSSLVSEVKLDLKTAKTQREMELAFENFEEEPEFTQERAAKTPEPKKESVKDHRRTMGSSLVQEVKLDLKAAKAQREMELAFENFEEEPEFTQERIVKTPELKKEFVKDHRRTMGSSLVSEVKLDLKAAKAQREMELAFENFEEEPEFTQERAAKTPEPKKESVKDHRRTMGSSLVQEVKLDLKAAKAQREMELAFENFEEEPEFTQERIVKTPEPKKEFIKDHRRTMGSSLVQEVKLDLKAAKAQREIELAFENFEEEPEFTQERAAKTPEPKKESVKDHRRTMGSSLVSEVKLDLKAAKAQREMELAFENFEEEPEFTQERIVKTPELKKEFVKDHRRTMGSSLVQEVKLDLKAAKAQREMELAFENFEEEPEFTQERIVKTPEPKKEFVKDHRRRTMGSSLVQEVKLDLKAAKAQREMELAFENFEEEPEFTQERIVKTPEPKKECSKDHRRTMGSSLVQEVKLDLKAAKAQREMELAFENFEEEPEFTQERAAKTPEPKKEFVKDHRRTMGSSLVQEVKLDLKAAKAQREMELAFENFEEEPEFTQERIVKTPEPKKECSKDHRRTMGSSLVQEVKLDLKAAKAQREMELAFENFEEKPEFTQERAAKTPEPKKEFVKDHRRTMGSSLVSEVKLDLKAAKAQREMELAFENFEEEPEFTQERAAKTPEPKKESVKDHRRTMGSSLVQEVKLDLKAVKAQREMELAFENFEEEPEFTQERIVKTPEPKKEFVKDHRRTMGSSLVQEAKLDLKAAKAQREMELAFENFEEKPEFTQERAAKTPEPKKESFKDHRRTMGSSLVQEAKLDLKAAKAQREMELAFENFEEKPEFTQERAAKTPEPKKESVKDHRRTMGSSLVQEVKLDLKAAKAQREMELAFENFEEKPEFTQERAAKTPEPKKESVKDHRRTMGSSLVSEVKLDLKAAKAQRDMELAFENFDEEQTVSVERSVQTPEPEKVLRHDHRRTMGTKFVPDAKLDLKVAKAEREIEFMFENFEEEATVGAQRLAKTPDVKKHCSTMRRSLGYRKVLDQSYDPYAFKSERETEEKSISNEKAVENQSTGTENLTPVTEISDDEKETQSVEKENSLKSDVNAEECATKTNDIISQLSSGENRQEDEEARIRKESRDEQSVTPVVIQSKNRRRRRGQNTTYEAENLQDHAINVDLPTDRIEQKTSTNDQLRDDENDAATTLEGATIIYNKGEDNSVSNSVDVTSKLTEEHETISNQGMNPNLKVDSTVRDEPHEVDQPENSNSKPKHRKNSSEEQKTIAQIDSTDVDSTDEEANHAPRTDRKRLRKITIIPAALSEAEKDIHHLEPIAEEEKKLDEEVLADSDAKEVTRSVRRRALGKDTPKQKNVRQEDDPKAVLKLNTDVDEIISSTPISSTIRMRGRRAQISLIFVESKTGSVSVDTDKEHTGEQESKIEPTEGEEQKVTEHDTEDVIESTPMPLRTRGRRPTIKVDSTESSTPVMRRGRRGSIQQDSQNKPMEVDVEDVAIVSTPMLSKTRGRRAVLNVESKVENSTPGRKRGGRHGTSTEVNSEKAVSSTPVSEPTQSTAEKAPTRAANTLEHMPKVMDSMTGGSTQEDVEEVSSPKELKLKPNLAESVTESSTLEVPLKARRRRAVLQSKPTEPAAKSSTPARKRGRKATAEEVVPFTESVLVAKVALVPEDGTKHDTDVKPETSEVGEVVPSTPVPEPTESTTEKVPEVHTVPTINTFERMPMVKDSTQEDGVHAVKADEDNVLPTPAVPSKTRGRRAALKSTTPVRKTGRKATAEEVVPSTEGVPVAKVPLISEGDTKHDTDVKPDTTETEEVGPSTSVQPKPLMEPSVEMLAEDGKEVAVAPSTIKGSIPAEVAEEPEVGEAIPSTPVPSKQRGRRAALKVEPVKSKAESSTPARKRTRRATVDHDVELHAEEIVMTSTTIESSTPEDAAEHETKQTAIEEVVAATPVALKSRGRRAAIKMESVESTTESSIPVDQDRKTKTGETALVPFKRRGRPVGQKAEPMVEIAAEHDTGVKTDEVVPSTPVLPWPRARRAALKVEPTAESSIPARKRGRRGNVEQDVDIHKPKSASATTEGSNPEESAEHDVDIQTEETSVKELIPSKAGELEVALESTQKKVRRGTAEIHTEEATVAPLKRRGRPMESKVEPTVTTTEGSAPEEAVVHDTDVRTEETAVELSIKPRGRKVEPTAEGSTPARKRGRRGNHEQDGEIHEERAVVASTAREGSTPENATEHNTGTAPVQPKQRGRRAALKVQPTAETSSPTRRRGRRGNVEQDADIHAEEDLTQQSVAEHDTDVKAGVIVVVEEVSKPRGRKAALKIEPVEPTAENSTPTLKRGRRRHVEQDTEIHKNEAVAQRETEEIEAKEANQPTPVPSQPRGRRAAVKSEHVIESTTPALKRLRRGTVEQEVEAAVPSSKTRGRAVASQSSSTESSTPVGRGGETNTEEDYSGEVISSKRRGRQVVVKSEPIEFVENETEEQDTVAEAELPSKKRGRLALVKLEPTKSSADSPVSVRKRGRRGLVQEYAEEAPNVDTTEEVLLAVAKPFRARGRAVKLKMEISTPNVPITKSGEKKHDESTKNATPVKRDETIIETSKIVQSVEKKKSTRSRRASPSQAVSESEHNNVSEKPVQKVKQEIDVSQPEEEQAESSTAPKPARGRKPAVKTDTLSEKEENKSKARGRKAAAAARVHPLEENKIEEKLTVSEEPNKKPTRGRKGAQPKTETDTSQDNPSSSATKKTLRGQKAAKDTDDEQSEIESQKNPTRSRKAQPPKEEQKAVPKRGVQRNLEVTGDDENTPSKRQRRKPNIFLSDEFVH